MDFLTTVAIFLADRPPWCGPSFVRYPAQHPSKTAHGQRGLENFGNAATEKRSTAAFAVVITALQPIPACSVGKGSYRRFAIPLLGRKFTTTDVFYLKNPATHGVN